MSERILPDKLWSLIQASEKIALTAHIHPDGDAIGSTLAFYHVLKNMGKSAEIFMKDHIPNCFNILRDVDVIQPKPDKKLKFDLLILLDAKINRTGGICEMIDAPILNIDHHLSNDEKADFLVLEADSSSTSEILFHLMNFANVKITKDIADCLYVGIATDTGFFRFDNTTLSAMEASAELVRCGARPSVIAGAMATKTFTEIEQIAMALQTIELFNEGKVIGVFLDERLADLELTDTLIDMIRFTEGVDIAFLLKYESHDVYRLRMRSHVADVTKITGNWKGGGHMHAAGATLKGPFAEVRKQLLESITQYIENSHN